MLKTLKVLIPVFLLNACSSMPSGPSVLVLPGTGKDYNHSYIQLISAIENKRKKEGQLTLKILETERQRSEDF